jgi:hypothetical protein
MRCCRRGARRAPGAAAVRSREFFSALAAARCCSRGALRARPDGQAHASTGHGVQSRLLRSPLREQLRRFLGLQRALRLRRAAGAARQQEPRSAVALWPGNRAWPHMPVLPGAWPQQPGHTCPAAGAPGRGRAWPCHAAMGRHNCDGTLFRARHACRRAAGARPTAGTCYWCRWRTRRCGSCCRTWRRPRDAARYGRRRCGCAVALHKACQPGKEARARRRA